MSGQHGLLLSQLAPTCHYLSSSLLLSLNVATTESYKWSSETLLALLVPGRTSPLTPGSRSGHCQHFRPGWAAISNTRDKSIIPLIPASPLCNMVSCKLGTKRRRWNCFYVILFYGGIFKLFYYRFNCFYPARYYKSQGNNGSIKF